MTDFFEELWRDAGQAAAEYAVVLVVILALIIGVVRLIAVNSNTIFSRIGSAIQ